MKPLPFSPAVVAALAAALLFGASTPFAKQLLRDVSPVLLAGLLYLGSGIGLLAAAQVLSAVGGPGLLEHDVMENPLREALAQPFPRVQHGLFPLPDGPGLGAEPDLDAAAGWLMTRAEYRASR